MLNTPSDLAAPEFQLLAACARWPASAARREAVTAAVNLPLFDWAKVLQAVRRHRIAGLLRHGLADAGIAVPDDIAQELGRRVLTDTRHNLLIVGRATRLVGLLKREGIAPVVLKGPPLMAQAYGDLTVRASHDLDLLVPVKDIRRAIAICEAAEYKRILPPPNLPDHAMEHWLELCKDVIFRDDVGVTLELHHRPTVSRSLSDQLNLSGGVTEVAVASSASLPTPPLDALYPYLCIHGALCAWFRLKWIADVAALTAGLSDDELVALHNEAAARGAARASAQALLLVQALFGRTLPARIRPDRKSVRLANFALQVMSDPLEPHQRRWRPARIQLGQLLLTEDWTFRREAVTAWLMDWPTAFRIGLPRPLRFLYPLMRAPAWLVRRVLRPIAGPADH